MAESFHIGDIVMLKSGGPAMTVDATGEQVDCVWFAKEEKKSATFQAALLKKIG
jgi:uncharacterized protein YodC (DUF2158 family)